MLRCGGRILLERKSVRDALDRIFESSLTNDLNLSCYLGGSLAPGNAEWQTADR